jgi:hypothetical protein
VILVNLIVDHKAGPIVNLIADHKADPIVNLIADRKVDPIVNHTAGLIANLTVNHIADHDNCYLIKNGSEWVKKAKKTQSINTMK